MRLRFERPFVLSTYGGESCAMPGTVIWYAVFAWKPKTGPFGVKVTSGRKISAFGVLQSRLNWPVGTMPVCTSTIRTELELTLASRMSSENSMRRSEFS